MSIRITQVETLSKLCLKGEFDRVGQALIGQHPIRAATLAMLIKDQLAKTTPDAEEKFYRYLIECENRFPTATPVAEVHVHDHMTIPEIILEVIHQTETHPKRSIHRTAEKIIDLQGWINPLSRTEAAVLVDNYTSILLQQTSDQRQEVLKSRKWPTEFKTPLPTPYPGKKTSKKP
jgi:hypothetical protein